MKLTAWLEREGVPAAQFARRIGVKGRMTVRRYCDGSRIPDRDVMARIVEQTSGEVQPNDFYDIAPPANDRPEAAA